MERKGKHITYASRHMSTLWNPFSYKNTEPKYPDGLAQYSIGQKYTNHFVVEGEDILLLLYPGLVNSVLAFSAASTSDAIVRGIALHADDGDLFERHTKALPDSNDQPIVQYVTLSPSPKFSSWRPVSYAIKIQPISNHQAIECGKDGWWEAIRLNGGIDDNTWGVHGFQQTESQPDQTYRDFGGPTSDVWERTSWQNHVEKKNTQRWINGKGTLQPVKDTMQTFQSSEGWTLQPSYSRGCVRDIQCWTFQLNNIRRDNEFIDVRGVSIIAPGAQTGKKDDAYEHNDVKFLLPNETYDKFAYGEYKGVVTSSKRNGINYEHPSNYSEQDNTRYKRPHTASIEGFNSLHSSAFDSIAIKLHAREKSRFIVQCVANIEYLAYNDSTLQEYTTTSYSALEELSQYLDTRSNDYKFPNHNYFRDKLKF